MTESMPSLISLKAESKTQSNWTPWNLTLQTLFRLNPLWKHWGIQRKPFIIRN